MFGPSELTSCLDKLGWEIVVGTHNVNWGKSSLGHRYNILGPHPITLLLGLDYLNI